MSFSLNAAGTVSVATGEVRINLSTDFCKYYRSLLLEALSLDPIEFQVPKHGAHITIVSRKIPMKDNDLIDLSWVIMIVLVVAFAVACTVAVTRTSVQRAAVKAGAAKWVVDQYGDVDFKWLSVEAGTLTAK
jgi:hypothetical protein